MGIPPLNAAFLTQAAYDEACASFCGAVECAVIAVTTHDIVVLSGLETPAVVDAISTYLLNCAAGTIQIDLSLLNDLLGVGPEANQSLHDEIQRLIGSNNQITDQFRTNYRDPWITEALGHFLLSSSRTRAELPPIGHLHTIATIHNDVKDHGIDLVGIYETGLGVGLAIGESKASELHGTARATEAAAFFAEVESGSRDGHIRSRVLMLRSALAAPAQMAITASFWQNESSHSAYLVIGNHGFDVNSPRVAFGGLTRRATIVVAPLTDYRGFFDSIANQMRARVQTLLDGGNNNV